MGNKAFAAQGTEALRLWRLMVCSLFLFVPLAPAPGQQAIAWGELDQILASAARASNTDIELIVLHRDTVVYRDRSRIFGEPQQDVLPIASASKWLAAATILSLVDEGLLSLDDPAGLYLHYVRADKADIRLRHLLSHTAGLGGSIECLFEARRSLDQCATEIAESPLLFPPGRGFHYTDASLHLAGRMAEVAAGRSWNDIFQERIAAPLGMTQTTFLPNVPTANPQVSAGAQSTADDYLRFLRMIRNQGMFEGRRVLSARSVALMLADQTAGAEIRFSPYSASEGLKEGASQNRYGLGVWIEGMQDGLPDAQSAQGAFGVSPYYDARRDLAFLAFLREDQARFQPFYYQIQDFLNRVFPLPAPPAAGEFLERALDGAGESLTWLEYAPAACATSEASCPVLVVMPGAESGAADPVRDTDLRQKAEREGIRLVLPQNGAAAWSEDQVLALAEQLRLAAGADSQRLYLAGVAEGASLAQRVACLQAEWFAGLALLRPVPMEGYDATPGHARDECEPRAHLAAFVYSAPWTAPVNDVPMAGDPAAFWRARNRCADTRSFHPGDASAFTFVDAVGCAAGFPVRELRQSTAGAAAPGDGWDFALLFLRGQRREELLPGRLVATSAAHYWRRVSAPGALVSLFGADLAPETRFAQTSPLPAVLGRTRVEFRDARGLTRNAPLVMVSPLQINLVVPEEMAPGTVSIFVYRDTELSHRDWMVLDAEAPALFSANASGEGLPAGEVLYVAPSGMRRQLPLAVRQEPDGTLQAQPVDLGTDGTEVYLTLYGTGWGSAATQSAVSVELGGVALEPLFAGPQGQFAGLDQINLRLDGTVFPPGTQRVRIRAGTAVSATLSVETRQTTPD